jgi:hypothetical protein
MATSEPNPAGAKYRRTIRDCLGGNDTCTVDVYSVLQAFAVVNPALQHAAKKVLCAGIRGKGSFRQDVTEAIEALQRALVLEKVTVEEYLDERGKKVAVRTKAQVLAERKNNFGCCDRYADRKACDCLETAADGCNICGNPSCDNPGGKH